MFENLIATFLNKFLGEYLDGLHKEQLNVQLFAGNVQLRNLRVKPSALDFLQLPIAVKSGVVESLVLKANWAKLSSEPVRIELKRLVVVAGPRTSFDVNEAEERQRAQSRKRDRLKANEELKLATHGRVQLIVFRI